MIHDFHFFLAVKTRDSFVPERHFPKKRKPLNWKIDNFSHPGVLSGSKTRNESVIDARMRGRKWTNT